jgi:hypothetical protein
MPSRPRCKTCNQTLSTPGVAAPSPLRNLFPIGSAKPFRPSLGQLWIDQSSGTREMWDGEEWCSEAMLQLKENRREIKAKARPGTRLVLPNNTISRKDAIKAQKARGQPDVL